MKAVCLLFAVALCWTVTAQDLSDEVAALRREVDALKTDLSHKIAFNKDLRLEIEYIKREIEALRKEAALRKEERIMWNPSRVDAPAPAASQEATLRITELTNNGQQYMKLSDGSLWNMYSADGVVSKWGTGSNVQKIGVPDLGEQKFKGPDGNIAKGRLEN
jgi:regulator of replication initiation timing